MSDLVLKLFGRAKPEPSAAERQEQFRSQQHATQRERGARIQRIEADVARLTREATAAHRRGDQAAARSALQRCHVQRRMLGQLRIYDGNEEALRMTAEGVGAAGDNLRMMRAGAAVTAQLYDELGGEDDIAAVMDDVQEAFAKSGEILGAVAEPLAMDAIFPDLTEDAVDDELARLDAAERDEHAQRSAAERDERARRDAADDMALREQLLDVRVAAAAAVPGRRVAIAAAAADGVHAAPSTPPPSPAPPGRAALRASTAAAGPATGAAYRRMQAALDD